MMENVARIHITEADLVRELHDVLAKVQQGLEVIVEHDHRPIAVIRRPHRSGLSISEILQQANERNSTVTLDSEFANDLEAIIAAHDQPWNPPSWE